MASKIVGEHTEGFRVLLNNLLMKRHDRAFNMDYEISLTADGRASGASDSLDPDQALARAIAGGDSNAWDRFFDRYSQWAYRFAYYHLNGNRADAEDLCSDIMLTAARGINTFDATRGTLDVWLLGLARHRLAQFCRRRKIEVPSCPEIIELHADSDVSSPEDFTDKVIVQDAVNQALASLPERQASALIDKYVEGYSTEEIARMHGASPKAIESLLSRARDSFRAVLSGLLEIAERRHTDD